jgi:hypothetical protein
MSRAPRILVLLALVTAISMPSTARELAARNDVAEREHSTSALMREQLGTRVEAALARRDARPLRFEVVEISHWRLQPREADFVLWGLLYVADAPARMLRVESRINRRSLALGELQLQSFDELQARQSPPPR